MRQRHWARVLLLVTVLALALGHGSAKAATPSAGTISAGSPTTTWQGEFYTAAALIDPSLCPPAAIDPIDFICDHFRLLVQNAGAVTVTINWPSDVDDFDLYVYQCMSAADTVCGTLVDSSANAGTTSEQVIFTATANTTYEIRVIPFAVVASDYTGRATLVPTGGGGQGGGGGIDPPISITDARVTEGDTGTRNATFTVWMDHATISPVTVNYVTADPSVTTTATAGSDFVPQTGAVVFAPGQTQTTLTVPILSDMAPEANETFVVKLFLPDPALAVAKIEDGQGFGTIANDDWGRVVSGSGKVGNVLTGEGSFSFWAAEWQRWGKISFRQGSVRFYSSRITAITFNDTAHTATVQGSGYKNGTSVTYTLDVADNGLGTLDGFVLSLSDGTSASGPLTSGDISYRG